MFFGYFLARAPAPLARRVAHTDVRHQKVTRAPQGHETLLKLSAKRKQQRQCIRTMAGCSSANRRRTFFAELRDCVGLVKAMPNTTRQRRDRCTRGCELFNQVSTVCTPGAASRTSG